MVPFSRILFASSLAALFALAGSAARGDEVCDEFPDVHTHWNFRVPACGPTLSFTDRDGFARIHVPDGATAGSDFDNWTGADRAPSLERSDMGSGDWTITTRLDFETPVAGNSYHVALMFGFGPATKNDVVYFGQYTGEGILAVERSGNQIRPTFTADPGPISIQVEKVGADYHFRHRNDDTTEWIEDAVNSADMVSADPVTRVGVMVKAYGGIGSPEVIADFDYFCLKVPATLSADPVSDPIPTATPIQSLSCDKAVDGSVKLAWSTCPDTTTPIVVKINGTLVHTLAPDAVQDTVSPPFPGGSILHVEVDNGFRRAAACTLARIVVDLCDPFDEDPLGGGIWTFRTPQVVPEGPTLSTDANPGFLRFFVPAGSVAGKAFDNWAGADFAPTLERYDMGNRDWVISTRFQYPDDTGPPGLSHHVGLFFAYGLGAPQDSFNDVTYWGEYYNNSGLRVERSGSALTGVFPYPGSPVSLQIQKVGTAFTFSHRQDDADPWTNDATVVMQQPFPFNLAGSPGPDVPVSRVGIIIKTWNGTASPEVTADFDYFCMQIADSPPEAKIAASPLGGMAPLEVSFSGVDSEDPSGGTLTYQWDFGDGTSGSGVDVKHTYEKGGFFTATLTATDDEKNAGTASVDLYISDPAAPFAIDRLGTLGLNGFLLVDRSGAQPIYCLRAGGDRISLTSENAFFLHQKLTGDFQVSARITGGDFTAASARAGLMARLSTDPQSPNVMMSVDGQNDGYQFQFRKAQAGTTNRVTVTVTPPRGPLPSWIRLARSGTTFIGSYSLDGTTFTEYGRQDLPNLNVADLEVGWIATSGDDARFSEYCAELSGFPAGPEPPSKPTGLSAAAGNGKVTLDWNDNPEAGLAGYNLYRSDGGPFAKVNPAPLPASGYLDGGLINGTNYCYRVRAVNGVGESADSDQACATPVGGAVATFRRGDVDSNGVVEITDAVKLLGYLFLGGGDPECLEAGDTDDNGVVDITDAVTNLGYQFLGQAPPASPGPITCGPDAQPPFLGCAKGCP
jgi:PKD repeat protein